MGTCFSGQHQYQGPPLCGGRTKTACEAGKKGAISNEWLGVSRGGRNTKIHVLAEGNCLPLAVVLSSGQESDPKYMVPLLDEVRVKRPGPGRPRKHLPSLRVDRAYGQGKYRRQLRARKIKCICPEREDTRRARLSRGRGGGRPTQFDVELYKERNGVERGINRMKDFRALATRYEKRGHQFLAVVHVVCIVLWL